MNVIFILNQWVSDYLFLGLFKLWLVDEIVLVFLHLGTVDISGQVA